MSSSSSSTNVLEIIEDTYELIATASSVDVAKGVLLTLMLRERHGVIVTRDANVSNSQWNKFNKWARSVFYCTRVNGAAAGHAFRVHQTSVTRKENT
jgi:hypothetical protein